MRCISLMSSGHSIQMQKNTPSSQVHMKYSPGKITSWVTNQTSVNLRKLKSYQASSLSAKHYETRYQLQEEEKNCEKHKHMEIKQHICK